MYVLIDNFDSFTYNLVQHLGVLGAKVSVYRNNEITSDEVVALNPKGIIISPGPCGPENTGICISLTQAAAQSRIPLLGVCLGHQVIGVTFGGKTIINDEIVHGKIGRIEHDGTGVMAGLESPVHATRYHSLVVERESLPKCLKINGWLENGTIMGLQHESLPIHGVQFHPESIATDKGFDILDNFLKLTH